MPVTQAAAPTPGTSSPTTEPRGRLVVISGAGEGTLEGELSIVNADGSDRRTIGPIGLIGGYDVSPDGTQIAFVHARTSDYAVCRVATAGGQLTELAQGIGPHWSPDGRHIAFVGAHEDLYIMNADGGAQIRLTTHGGVKQVQWAPDGQQIAYLRCATEDGLCQHKALAVVDADGHHQRQLADENLRVGSFAWAPDGAALTFVSHHNELGDIYRVNRDGSAQLLLATGGAYAPTWSPDGKHIAFITNDGKALGISIMNADGSQLMHLIEGNELVWSPDGTYLAIAASRATGSDLYVIQPDGAQKTRLAEGFGPTWSPDGAYIAFTAARADAPGIYVMRADGSHQTRVFTEVGSARWLPSAAVTPPRTD